MQVLDHDTSVPKNLALAEARAAPGIARIRRGFANYWVRAITSAILIEIIAPQPLSLSLFCFVRTQVR